MLASATIHAAFARHYVSVTSPCVALLEEVGRNLEPMMSVDAHLLQQAGAFRVQTADDGGWVIHDESCDLQERWSDMHAAVRALQHALIKRFMQTRPDLVWIHAGVVRLCGQAVLMVGPPGQGKSTLVAELLDWGCDYLSDEVAAIDPAACTVLPFALAPYKRVAMATRVPPERLHEIPKIAVPIAPAAICSSPVPIRSIYFLRTGPSPDTAIIEAASPAVSLLEISRNSFTCELNRGEEMARLCKLLARVDAAYLEYAHPAQAASRIIQAAARA
jgi:hypothetical protein